MGPKPRSFTLPETARRSLTDLLRKGTHRARTLNRARVLLKLDQGMRLAHIARDLGLSVTTVINIRRKAEQHGWQRAIYDNARSGRPARISGTSKAKITALACSDPPAGRSRWTVRLLADRAVELGYVDAISHEYVRQILKKTNLSRT